MRAAVLVIVGLGLCAGTRGAFAQATAAAPTPSKKSTAPAAQPTPAAQPAPAATPAPIPPPIQAAPAAPEAPPPEAPTDAPPPPSVPPQPPGPPPPPPTYGPGHPPPEPPPGPVYQRLGKTEPEIEKGDWDPWEHSTPEQHNHDGFYLRLAIGFGGGSLWGNDHILPGVRDVTLSGLGFGTSIGIGGAVANNFILNADLFQATLFNPSVHQDGRGLGDASNLSHDLGVGQNVSVAGLGIGATYYIMPVNVYLAGSIGFGQAVFEDHVGSRSPSDFGLATNWMVGKEWWVGSDWGIGIAGQLIVLATHDDILGGLHGAIFNVMFSATYN
jgi:hypothetical protein